MTHVNLATFHYSDVSGGLTFNYIARYEDGEKVYYLRLYRPNGVTERYVPATAIDKEIADQNKHFDRLCATAPATQLTLDTECPNCRPTWRCKEHTLP